MTSSAKTSQAEAPKAGQGDGSSCSSCRTFYFKLSHLVTNLLESFFYRYGLLVGTYPKTTLVLSLVLCAVFTCGLYKSRKITNDSYLWTPAGSPYIAQAKWIAQNFPKDKRYENIIIHNGDSGNVLKASYMQYLLNIHKTVINVTSPSGLTTEDVCFKPPYSDACFTSSLISLWKFDESIIANLTDQDVLQTVSMALQAELAGGTTIGLSQLLSGIKYGSDGVSVVSAEAVMAVWILKNNGTYNEGGSLVDEQAISWEDAFIHALVDSSGYDQGGDINTNGNQIPGKPDDLQMEVMAEYSFDDAIDSVLMTNSINLYAGGTLMLVFVALVLGRCNALEQRVLLSLCGLVVIGFALLASFGFCFFMDYYTADMHPVIPFLLLGIGVDDMFVIVKALDNLSLLEKGLPTKDKVALTMKHAGVSITVTSITDMVAFLIGATTSIPILKCFCVFASMGVLFLYIFSVTFFVACLTLDEARLDARKCCACLPPKGLDWKPNTLSQISFGQYIIGKALPKLLFKTPVKVLVMATTLGLLAAGIYGVTQIELNYNPVWYMDRYSYQVRYFNNLNKYFPGKGERVEIYLGNVKYWDYPDELKRIETEIVGNPYVNPDSFDFWYSKFYAAQCSVSPEAQKACAQEGIFKRNLVKFLFSHPRYLDDIKFNDTSTGQIADNPIQAILGGHWEIEACRARFQHIRLPDTNVQNQAMDSVKGSMNLIVFEGEAFSSPIVYSFYYVQWEANKVISLELVRNLGLTFATISALVFLFVPNLQVVAMTLCCVGFTVINTCGFAHYMDLTIEIVTSIMLILSVGLAVDYCVHISIQYVCYRSGSRRAKSRKCLEDVGTAVFNGGFSTFLAFFIIAWSRSYIYKTFFKMFSMVILFGLYHGLIFLPVVLSLLGPQPHDLKDDEDDDAKPAKELEMSPSVVYVNKAFRTDDESWESKPSKEPANANISRI